MKKAPSRQRGYSLVGMMVGLVISLLTIAAMLAVYKMMVEVSGRASADSLRDGQVASGLLAAQVELHSAGFGIDLPDVPEGGIVDPGQIAGAVAVDASGRGVSWRYVDVDGFGIQRQWCAGLQIAPHAEGRPYTRLYYLAPKTACSAPPAVSAWAADEKQVLATYDTPWQDRQGNAVEAAASGFYLDAAQFRLADVADAGQRCTLPFAQQLRADSATESPRLLLEADGGRELFSVCLSNIVAYRKPAAAPPSGGSS